MMTTTRTVVHNFLRPSWLTAALGLKNSKEKQLLFRSLRWSFEDGQQFRKRTNRRGTFKLTRCLGLICCRIFLIDSPSDRPSKSMKTTLALISRVCVTATHFAGTSDVSSGEREIAMCFSTEKQQSHRKKNHSIFGVSKVEKGSVAVISIHPQTEFCVKSFECQIQSCLQIINTCRWKGKPICTKSI